jgi:trimethylamine:corrinoid methyltransferase-like protein
MDSLTIVLDRAGQPTQLYRVVGFSTCVDCDSPVQFSTAALQCMIENNEVLPVCMVCARSLAGSGALSGATYVGTVR